MMTVRTDRPRIWITPERLAALRQAAASGSPAFVTLKKQADDYLNSPDSYQTSIENYALMFLLTQEQKYADKAIAIMQGQISRGAGAIARDAGFDSRSLFPAFACGWDWLGAALPAEKKQQWLPILESWGNWIWPETNPTRAEGWGVNVPGSNYWHGFMRLWMLGLALYKESSHAPVWVDLCRNRWVSIGRPYADKFEKGGYGLEGTNYDKGSQIYFLSAAELATDEQHLTGWDWTSDFLRARLYLTTPSLRRLAPLGDQARDSNAYLSSYDRGPVLAALSFARLPEAQWARWWLSNARFGTPFRWLLWQELLWERNDIEAVDYRSTLPTHYFAPGSGWFTDRTDWSATATALHTQCGPLKQGAQDRAAAAFMLWSGDDWITGPARLNSASGLLPDTPFHNALLVSPDNQTSTRSETQAYRPTPSVEIAAAGPSHSYVRSEARGAYYLWVWPTGAPGLKSYRRHLLWAKPDYFLVLDEVEPANQNQVPNWQLHALTVPTVVGNKYSILAEKKALHGKLLLPPLASLTADPVKQGQSGAVSSWRILSTEVSGWEKSYFLNAMALADPAATVHPVEGLVKGENCIGAIVNDCLMLFAIEPDKPLRIPLSVAITRIVIAGLRPGDWVGPRGGAPISVPEGGVLDAAWNGSIQESDTLWLDPYDGPPIPPVVEPVPPPVPEPEEPVEPAPTEPEPIPELPVVIGTGNAELVIAGVPYAISFEVKRKGDV